MNQVKSSVIQSVSGEGSAQAGFLLSTFCFVAHKQKERIILYICDPKNLGSFCRTPFLQAFGSIYFPKSASKCYKNHLLWPQLVHQKDQYDDLHV